MKTETKIMTITPTLATKWLKKNTRNRPLKDVKVKQYADQMKKGLWHITNDDICFSTEDILINGQNRLNAIVKSGCDVKMGVKFNCDPESFKVMDSDISVRSAGDGLSISGISNGNAKAAIAKNYMMHKKGLFTEKGSVAKSGLSTQEIINFGEKHQHRLDEVYGTTKKIVKKFKTLSGQYVGSLYWTFSDISQDHADAFFQLYSTGIGLEENHPVYALRSRLISDLQSMKRYTNSDKVAWMILAWNGFREKRKMSKIQWNPDKMDFPKPI